MFKVNKKRQQNHATGVVLTVFIVNFENFSLYSSVSIVKFEQVNASWVLGCPNANFEPASPTRW